VAEQMQQSRWSEPGGRGGPHTISSMVTEVSAILVASTTFHLPGGGAGTPPAAPLPRAPSQWASVTVAARSSRRLPRQLPAAALSQLRPAPGETPAAPEGLALLASHVLQQQLLELPPTAGCVGREVAYVPCTTHLTSATSSSKLMTSSLAFCREVAVSSL